MKNVALSLTPAKCELLDNILNEFDEEIYIKSERVLKIFRGNGNLASDYLDLLVKLNLVILVGQVEGIDLPAMVGKQAGVDMFISEGGFKRRYALGKLEEDAGKTIEDIQNENLDLQEKLIKNEQIISKLEQELLTAKNKNVKYFWLQICLVLFGVTIMILLRFYP
ncbi:hypothetical protein [Pedobacter mucosus]|uniref:hypothetical protein n=1 Tax=Pedobacter mucosus TaxID=2895286 RepID=UPI001EE3C578|nr:hypothetical protein [Pedobacter mucosus]UKT65273.1 hypothetical protein LOK61_05700 [Pedobacter mucosus]